jgi:hypothetical protein
MLWGTMDNTIFQFGIQLTIDHLLPITFIRVLRMMMMRWKPPPRLKEHIIVVLSAEMTSLSLSNLYLSGMNGN